jgi:hypothetical protein
VKKIPTAAITRAAESFFYRLSPWVAGDKYVLYQRFMEHALGPAESNFDIFFRKQSYITQLSHYKKPHIKLHQYLTIYHAFQHQIKSELILLWQLALLPFGHLFKTTTFLSKNRALLSLSQKEHLRQYGDVLPDFMTIFENLSFEALGIKAVLQKPKSLLFDRTHTLSPLILSERQHPKILERSSVLCWSDNDTSLQDRQSDNVVLKKRGSLSITNNNLK